MEKLRVGKGGKIVIPGRIVKKMGLKGSKEVFVRATEVGLLLEKPKKDYGERIVKLLKQGLKDVEWEEIEKGREDREW